MPGVFSTPPLAALVRHGFEVAAVIVPAAAGRTAPLVALAPPRSVSSLPIINAAVQPTILQVGWQHDIPVYETGGLGRAATRDLLATLAPDVICVACWAWRVPASVLALAPLGVLNVHPSLLPAYRGPEPLFWTLRDGVLDTGVTVHRMDGDWDTGPILAQLPVVLPEGVTENEALARCAERGGEALVAAVRGLADETLAPVPQPAGGSYAPIPQDRDFACDTTWSAQRAYRFMRGVAGWGVPFEVVIGDERLLLLGARSYDATGVLAAPYERDGNTLAIQFSPGVLHAVERR